jgi:hypothetical protein
VAIDLRRRSSHPNNSRIVHTASPSTDPSLPCRPRALILPSTLNNSQIAVPPSQPSYPPPVPLLFHFLGSTPSAPSRILPAIFSRPSCMYCSVFLYWRSWAPMPICIAATVATVTSPTAPTTTLVCIFALDVVVAGLVVSLGERRGWGWSCVEEGLL